MKKRLLNVLLVAAGVFGGLTSYAQCGAFQSELFITISGGSFASEKWVDISDSMASTGQIIWDSDAGAGGGGVYGSGAGYVTSQAFCVYNGATFYVNAYDSYADSWDGTIYEVRDAGGTLVGNNGGATPDDGTNLDATGAFGDTRAQELEVSEAMSYMPPSCPAPTALNASNIMATAADLEWTSGGASEWDIQWGTAGFTLGSGTIVNTTTPSPYNLSGLTAATDYEFYVRDICGPGDSSVYNGPFAFSTPCATLAVPHLEDFTTFVPTCWDEAGTGTWMAGPSGIGASEWGHTDYLNNGGANDAVKVNLYNTGSQEWILSPVFDLSAGGPYELVINAGVTTYNGTGSIAMGSDDSVMVFVTTDLGVTWDRIHIWAESNNPGNAGTSANIDLSAYTAATTSFAIYASEGTIDDTEDFDFHIGDFEIRMPPACADPTAFTATAIDTNAVELTWSSTAPQDYIEYGPTGFTPGTGTAYIPSMSPDTVTGLMTSTGYDFYVQSICAVGDSSTWVGPMTATTLDPPAYCTVGGPTSTADSNIEGISMSGESTSISYTGCAPAVLGLEDQTVQVADVLTGYNYSVDVTFGTCGGNFGGAGEAWIDWNNDLVFDPSESIGTSSGTPGSAPWDGPVTFNFTVPVGATLGSTRMRVMQQESGSLPLDPCGSYSWGSMIDFTIDIAFGTSCDAISGLTTDFVGLDSLAFSWTAGGTETDWNVEVGTAGFMPGTGAGIYSNAATVTNDNTGGLMMGTDYDVYVQADCGADSSMWFGPLTITTLLTCPVPSGFGGMVLSSDSIALFWTPGDSLETEWLIEYGTSGFTAGTGTSMSTFGSPADTVTGLMGATGYDFYLQAVCGVADSSFWIGPISFMTPIVNDEACGAIALPVDGMEYLYTNAGATASPDEAGLSIPAGTGASTCSSQDGWCSFELTVTQAMWFTFDAPASGNVTISCSGNTYDGQLAVFSGTDCADVPGMTLIGANDDAPSGGLAPELTLCGLNPGETYFIMHDEYSGEGDGMISFVLTDVATNAGTSGSIDICETDTVDLFTALTSPDNGGVWSYAANPSAIVNGNMFDATILPDGAHEALYIISNVCATDTAIATVNINQLPSAGTAVTPFNACNTQTTSLWDGLTGTVELGGTWNDDTGTGLLFGNTFNSVGIPVGTYQFTYTVNNGICPAVSTTVDVIVNDCVGLNENPKLDLTVYPNPNNGSFAVRNNGLTNDVVAKMVDLNGKLVYTSSKVLNGGDVLEINANVESGIYMLYVSTADAVNTYKVVVK